jgi:hypothetical protein
MPLYLLYLIELILGFKLLEFEIGDIDKMENFLETILKLTIEATLVAPHHTEGDRVRDNITQRLIG